MRYLSEAPRRVVLIDLQRLLVPVGFAVSRFQWACSAKRASSDLQSFDDVLFTFVFTEVGSHPSGQSTKERFTKGGNSDSRHYQILVVTVRHLRICLGVVAQLTSHGVTHKQLTERLSKPRKSETKKLKLFENNSKVHTTRESLCWSPKQDSVTLQSYLPNSRLARRKPFRLGIVHPGPTWTWRWGSRQATEWTPQSNFDKASISSLSKESILLASG